MAFPLTTLNNTEILERWETFTGVRSIDTFLVGFYAGFSFNLSPSIQKLYSSLWTDLKDDVFCHMCAGNQIVLFFKTQRQTDRQTLE